MKKNREAFKKWFFSQIQKDWLQDFTPEVVDSEYFSFIILPIPEILYLLKNGKLPTEKLINFDDCDTKPITYWNIVQNHPIWKELTLIPSSIYFEFLRYIKVWLRDTFWLKTNNVNSHYKDLWLLFFWKWETPNFKSLEVSRITFWIKVDIKTSYKLWVNFAKSYSLWLKKLWIINN